jgi:hypothetical protein
MEVMLEIVVVDLEVWIELRMTCWKAGTYEV